MTQYCACCGDGAVDGRTPVIIAEPLLNRSLCATHALAFNSRNCHATCSDIMTDRPPRGDSVLSVTLMR